MSALELLARLSDELPDPEPVVPLAFIEDDMLPRALSLVEPAAFALASVQTLWGRYGPRN
jgi:hypothetical protein